MKVEQVVAAGVVMPACISPPVAGAPSAVFVPKLGEGIHGGRLPAVESCEEFRLHRLAPAFAPAVADAQCLGEEVFLCVDDVHQIAECSGRVIAKPDVDVDAAGAVHLRAGFAQSADNLLHHFDVFLAAHGADHLCGRVGDRSIAFHRPLASVWHGDLPIVEVSADVLGGCAEILDDDLCGALASKTGGFNLDAECLCSHGVSPFGVSVFACGRGATVAYTYITLCA